MTVAFAFLVRDALPLAPLWAEWLAAFPLPHRVYLHAASGQIVEVLDAMQVSTVPTTWEHTIAAHRALLAAARADDCTRFVLLSESCAPVAPPELAAEFLKRNVCYFNFHTRPVSARRRFPVALRPFYAWAEQWYILHRHAIDLLLDDELRFNDFRHCFADNEHWPLMTLRYHKKDIWVVNHPTTCTRRLKGHAHPSTFADLNEARLAALSCGSLFARKIRAMK